MGSVKRYLDEMMDFDRIVSQPGKYVSATCFEDKHLRQYIRQNLSQKRCSYYCGQGKIPKGAPLDKVLAVIFNGFCSRYDDATNGVGWRTALSVQQRGTVMIWSAKLLSLLRKQKLGF